MAKTVKTTESAPKAPRKQVNKQASEPVIADSKKADEDLPFTHAEVVPNEPSETAVAVLTAEEQTSREVARFNNPRNWIAEKKKAYESLAIKGVDDKEGYKAVKEAWQEMRNKRLAVQNKHKELKADYLTIGRGIDKEKNELCGLIEDVETPLKEKLDRIDAAKEEEKLRKEKEDAERLHNRISDLLSNGMKFDGSFYAIGENISMDVVTIKQMNDEQYQAFFDKVQSTNQEIIDAEKKRKEEEDAEKKRVQDQKEENERKEKEMEKEREDMRKEKHDARAEVLVGLGYVLNGTWYTFEAGKQKDTFQATTTAFADMSAEEWAEFSSAKRQKVSSLQDQDKQDQEEAKQAEEKKLRIAEREREVGRRFEVFHVNEEYLARTSKYESVPSITVHFDVLGSYTAEGWAEYMQGLADTYGQTLALENAEEERLNNIAEASRLAALSDSDKIYEWLNSLSALMAKAPAIQSEEVKGMWATFDETVAKAVDKFTDQLGQIK